MAVILLSLWVQLASLSFLLAGLHADLLVVRFFLFLAYLMLMIEASLGSPLWPNIINLNNIDLSKIAADALFWSILSLYVHGSSLMSLILDERKPKLSEDEEALWRMMYRTGGLSARIFQDTVARYLQVIQVAAGDSIPTEEHVFIIYKGRVKLQVLDNDMHVYSRVLLSSEMFDLKYLGLLGEKSIFEDTHIRCKALSKSKLFRIHKDDMLKISRNPHSKSVFQALLINNLSYLVESSGEINRVSKQAEFYCNKLFEPLQNWEQPKAVFAGSGQALKKPIKHFLSGMRRSFSLPWPFSRHPIGLRQTQLEPPPLRQQMPDNGGYSVRILPTQNNAVLVREESFG
jgi:hypothetical protein